MIHQEARTTAGKILRGEELAPGEKEMAAKILRGHPESGNLHAVRCDWCHESRTLFRDENEGPFERNSRGWRCVTCDESAASQEIRF